MNTSFVLYRRPDEQEVHCLQLGHPQTLHSIAELNGQSGFVMAPFYIDDTYPVRLYPILKEYNGWKQIEASELLSLVDTSRFLVGNENAEISGKTYGEVYDLFMRELTVGGFSKIVLSDIRRLPVKPDILLTYKQACRNFDTMCVCLLHLEDCGTWIIASPELLLSVNREKGKTVALAGTKLRQQDVNTLWDEKNICEQSIVCHYIEEVLKQYADEITCSTPRDAKAGNLLHRKTEFDFTLKENIALGDLLFSLHPTPAVCGLPKQKTYDFIVANEGYRRGYYSGFFGRLNVESVTELYVNLRCMQVHVDGITLYGGSGLLSSSEKESEWNEINRKMDTIGSVIVTAE